MSNTKQTAVQEAIETIEKMITIRNFQKLEQLKKEFIEKEKQQIIDAWHNSDGVSGEQYYNETFGK